MIIEQPLAWPARFFPEISSKAEVLHRLLPELLKTGTINGACCFLQQHIAIRTDASGLTKLPDSAVTKLFMAIGELLTVLRSYAQSAYRRSRRSLSIAIKSFVMAESGSVVRPEASGLMSMCCCRKQHASLMGRCRCAVVGSNTLR